MKFSKNLLNIVLLGIGFSFLFTAFNTSQQFARPVLGSTGSMCLSILYAVFTVFNFFCLLVIERLGQRVTMVLSSLCYTLFIASLFLSLWLGLVLGVQIALYACSALIGVGAACLWAAQGAYLTACSDNETRGQYAGTFWGLFQLSNVSGNIIAVTLLSSSGGSSESVSTLFFGVLTCVALAGNLLLMTLRKPTEKIEDSFVVSRRRPLKQEILATFKMLGNAKMLMICPLIFYTGLTLSYYSGELSEIVSPDGLSVRGSLTFICLGAAEVIGGFCLGKLSDFAGRLTVVWISGTLHAAAIALVYYLATLDATSDLAATLGYVAGGLIGLGDSGFNTQLYNALSSLFHDQHVVPAFACFKFVQSIAPTLGFFLSSYNIPLLVWTIMMGSFLVIGTITYSIALRRHLASPKFPSSEKERQPLTARTDV